MKLRFPYFNDSDVGYLDNDFLDDSELVLFIDSEEEEQKSQINDNEDK